MTAIGERWGLWRTSGVIGQLVRFGVTGVVVTIVYAAIYWPIATYGHRLVPLGPGAVWPLVAVVVAFACATAFGNVAHSRFSFKGHGRRDRRTAHRFVVVQLFGFALNAAFTWLLTGPLLHGPTWWPLVPATFLTPLATFWLQRSWVYA